jgi:hypothetical protein
MYKQLSDLNNLGHSYESSSSEEVNQWLCSGWFFFPALVAQEIFLLLALCCSPKYDMVENWSIHGPRQVVILILICINSGVISIILPHWWYVSFSSEEINKWLCSGWYFFRALFAQENILASSCAFHRSKGRTAYNSQYSDSLFQ